MRINCILSDACNSDRRGCIYAIERLIFGGVKLLLSVMILAIALIHVSDGFLHQDGITALSLAKSDGHLGVVNLLHRASIQPKKMVLYWLTNFPSSVHHLMCIELSVAISVWGGAKISLLKSLLSPELCWWKPSPQSSNTVFMSSLYRSVPLIRPPPPPPPHFVHYIQPKMGRGRIFEYAISLDYNMPPQKVIALHTQTSCYDTAKVHVHSFKSTNDRQYCSWSSCVVSQHRHPQENSITVGHVATTGHFMAFPVEEWQRDDRLASSTSTVTTDCLKLRKCIV